MKKLIIVLILFFSFALLADEYLTVPELSKKEVKTLSSFTLDQLNSKSPFFEMFNVDIKFVFMLIKNPRVISKEEKANLSFLKELYGLSKNASLTEVYFAQLKILKVRIFIIERVIKIRKERKIFSSKKEEEKNSAIIKRYKWLLTFFNRTINGSARYFRYTKKEW